MANAREAVRVLRTRSGLCQPIWSIAMRTRAFLISAAFALLIPLSASADEALDTARSEMESALGTVPPFIDLLPEGAQAGAWAFMKGSSGNPDGEIPAKYRELIALGVAAQIPCAYCAYAHTAFAKANGATDAGSRKPSPMAPRSACGARSSTAASTTWTSGRLRSTASSRTWQRRKRRPTEPGTRVGSRSGRPRATAGAAARAQPFRSFTRRARLA